MTNIIDKILYKNPNHIARDYDHDGVMNILDCKPYDPKKQGIIHSIGAGIARHYGAEKTAEKIEARGMERDKEKEEYRKAEREAYHKERLARIESYHQERMIKARAKGVSKARGGMSFGSFVSGIAKSSSYGLPRASTVTKGKKSIKYVPIKGKSGQFRKVTTKVKGTTSQRPKTMSELLSSSKLPKFF